MKSGVVIIVLLLTGCIQSPEAVITSLLPSSWEISVTEAAVPIGWSGSPECLSINANNPSEKYQHFMGFNYTAWHSFWFCPDSWSGRCTSPACEPTSAAQEYPADLLCECEDYKIYHISLGENSASDLPDKVREEFE